MTVKDWLGRARDIDKEIDMLIKEQESPHKNRRPSYQEYNTLIDTRIDELYATKREIIQVINRVKDSKLRVLLIGRYIRFLTWEQLADVMFYSDKWVKTTLHSRALKAAQTVISKEFLFIPVDK